MLSGMADGWIGAPACRRLSTRLSDPGWLALAARERENLGPGRLQRRSDEKGLQDSACGFTPGIIHAHRRALSGR